MQKTDILSLSLPELEEFVTSLGEPKYRASQIYGWLIKGADFDGMKNLPSALIAKLKETAFVARAEVDQKQVSRDGTVKYLFRLYDGEAVEGVLMKYNHGNSLCISSEVGCPMGCAFCASTIGGIVRKLYPSEMLSEIISAQNDSGERVSNVVMMGIGEPLDNYDNVIKFLRLVNEPEGLNIGYRHISLSTCGVVDKIYALSKEDMPITLSVSLHASSDEKRSELMPINKRWNIEKLLTACADYFKVTGRRISFEYTLVSGKNDTEADARELIAVLKKYCGKMPLHVNLIPVNNVTERGFLPSDRRRVDAFQKTLTDAHITATVRRKLGPDIDASCGQLRAKNK